MASEGPVVSGIAGRYASALFDLAKEAGELEQVGEALGRFRALLDVSDDLDRLCRNPVFTAEEQLAALGPVLDKAGIVGLAGNFLRLVASKRRLFAVRGMIAAYGALLDEHKGITGAQVTVAEPLSEKNRNAVIEALKGVTGRSISLTEKVDPSIVGGLVVKIGSRMVDASLKTKLNAIRLAMKEAR